MKVKILLILLSISFTSLSQDDKTNEDITKSVYAGYDHIYSNKDSAFYYFNKALKLAEQIEDYNTQLNILDYNIFISGYHYDMLNYRINLSKVENIIQTDSLLSQIENSTYYKNQFLLNKGNYYYKLGDYSQAKLYFMEIYQKISEKKENNLTEDEVNTLLSLYNFLASIYKNTGKYDLSELYYKKAITIASQINHSKDFQISIAPTNLLLSQLYINTREFDKANLLLEEMLILYKNLYRKEKKYKNNLITVYHTLVKSSIQEEKFEQSLTYLKNCDQYITEDDPFFKQSLLLYAKVFSNLKKDKEALDFYEKALFAYEEYRQHKPHIDIANIYAELSAFYLNKNNFKEGLKHINKGITAAGATIKLDSLEKALNQNRFFSNRQVLELLDLKNQHLMLAYKTTENIKFLNEALQINDLILHTFQLLKREFNSKLDKQYLLEKADPIFNRMLGITFDAYSLNPKKELLVAALNISEKSKDILLLDAIRDVNAINFKNVPQEVTDKELIYKSDINITEKAIFNSENSKELNSLNEELFQLKNDYYQFLDTLSKNHPAYYNLKYKENQINLEAIRDKILTDNQLIISYTVSEDFIYTIAVNNITERFMRIPFSKSKSDSISQFYTLLSKPSVSGINKLKSSAEQLYSMLLGPILSNFDEENLIIIQSGILHYIPFEVLIDKSGKHLLFTKTISYNSSLSSLLELKKKEVENNGRLLAFAPEFGHQLKQTEGNSNFSALLHNMEEVNNIDQHIQSDIYLSNQASINNFNDLASDYKVLHLATHATANDEFPDYSYLAFSENDSSASTLFIKDLYDFQINAQLVTLSACQTGIGKLQKGEGMMSMAKGFYYAGAKSMVKSLWKINDKSTAQLMNNFYQELSEGKSKDIALKNAKLNYLASTDDELLKHPYYWAAFVISGDTDAISDSNNLIIMLSMIAVLIIIFLILYKKRYRKS